ncbi:MAG: GerMN domain-containing protein [Lachnospiraceae bacterium]
MHIIMRKNKLIIMLLIMLCTFVFFGCSKEVVSEDTIILTVLSADSSTLVEIPYELQSQSVENQVSEILEELSKNGEMLEYTAPLSQGIEIISQEVAPNRITLNLSAEYNDLSDSTEILTRAAIVKSLTQAEGIEYVSFRINGEPLRDSLGNYVGALSQQMFIDDTGEEIKSYEMVTVRLYFANEEGDALIAVNRISAYNSNMAIEKYILEELIKGPMTETLGVNPTINPSTKLINVTVKDEICYVNFDQLFLKQLYDINSEVAIYSVVNSLCELANVEKVVISVEGESDVLFRETISLKQEFEKDLSYVQID